MLTAGQKAAFDTFGFLSLRRLFRDDEMATIAREFDDVLAEDRQGLGFSGEGRQMVQSFVEKRPALTQLIDDDRIYGLMVQLLGPDLIWVTSDGNLYVGDTAWHHDATVKGYPQVKVTLYLDPVQKESGCLRVIPGSHEPPYHHALEPLTAEANGGAGFGVAGAEVPCHPVESEPGDVTFFNQTIWHASFGGRAGRRMLAMNYMPNPTSDEQRAYLRSLYAAVIDHDHPREAFLESGRPGIEAIVTRLRALGLE